MEIQDKENKVITLADFQAALESQYAFIEKLKNEKK